MILVHCIDEDDNVFPQRQYRTDAGLDLKSAEDITLEPGESAPVGCGIIIEIPPGYVGLVFPRSGLSTKKGLVLKNTIGVIDADYRGEVICYMTNTGSFKYSINKYERIAQLVVIPCLTGFPLRVGLEDLTDTERGDGGFGSTDL